MRPKSKDRILDYVIVSLLAAVIICISMQVWKLDFNVLPATSDDKMLGVMLFQSIKENGLKGIWINPSLGAPEFSSLIDTPFIDYPMCIMIWFLVNVLPSSNMAFYLFYILSFPLTAVAMLFLVNRYSLDRFINITMSVLFSIVPYHFLRGSLHSTLSSYYAIPIGLYLALVVFHERFDKGSPIFLRDSLWKKILFWISIVYVGLSNVYYAFFSMLIILIAVVYKMIESKSWKPVVQEARVFFVMAGAFLVGILPKLVFGIVNGMNTASGIRLPMETEIYALKIIQLLLPPPYSRVGILRSIAENYNQNGFNVNENAFACLSVASKLGFVLLCVWVIFRLVKCSRLVKESDRTLNVLACFTLVLVLFCTAGGFGTIFSYLITPELRGQNRVSILIDAICILAVMLVLVNLLEKIHKKYVYAMVCFLFLGSLFLNVPIEPIEEQQISNEEHEIYKEFFKEIQNVTEENDMIYQLPMTKFPEAAPVHKMRDYSLLLGCVYTDGLKWSYGGEYGRNDIAMELYTDEGMSAKFVENILSSGFKGIYIDTFGFEDGGYEINNFYSNSLGIKPLISKNERLYYYPLDGLDSKDLKEAGILITERIIYAKMKNLYYSLNGQELSEDLCKEAAMLSNGNMDYKVIFRCLFDNSMVNENSNERFIRELYAELLGREPGIDEIKSWSQNLVYDISKEDMFVQICNSEEYINLM